MDLSGMPQDPQQMEQLARVSHLPVQIPVVFLRLVSGLGFAGAILLCAGRILHLIGSSCIGV